MTNYWLKKDETSVVNERFYVLFREVMVRFRVSAKFYSVAFNLATLADTFEDWKKRGIIDSFSIKFYDLATCSSYAVGLKPAGQTRQIWRSETISKEM